MEKLIKKKKDTEKNIKFINTKRFDVRTYTMIAALIILWIVFSISTHGIFLSIRNISDLFRQMSIVGILGIGEVLIIVTAGIDLSVGSVMGFIGGVLAACEVWGGMNTFEAVVIGFIVAGMIGFIQGSIIATSGVPPFIVTLGGMLVFRGGVLAITKGTTVAPLSPSTIFWGAAYLDKTVGIIIAVVVILFMLYNEFRKRKAKIRYDCLEETMGRMVIRWVLFCVVILVVVFVLNSYQGIPIPFFVMLCIVVLFTFIADRTTFGRSLYAIGGNLNAAKYSGLNIKKSLMIVYSLNALLAAVAGIILAARLDGGTPGAGQNIELDAIAAAVIGGTSMTGGAGKVAGAILGALVMGSIDNGMSLMNMGAFWQYIVKGIILVAAVWFDMRTKQKKS